MRNVSNTSVSCRKITEKGTKVFSREFSLCPAENLSWPGQRRNVQRICLQSFKAVPFSYLEFFSQKKGTQRWWTDILLTRSLSLAALLWITRCCYDVWPAHAIRWRFSCSQRKKLAICHFRLGVARARSRCQCPYRWEIRVSYVQSSCDVISRELFLCDSSPFSVERINEKIQFLSKP